MTLEEFIRRNGPCCDGECDDSCTGSAMHPSTTAAIADLAALREQVKTARLQGALEAFGIAASELRVSERGIEWDAALDAFLATFGEMAP